MKDGMATAQRRNEDSQFESLLRRLDVDRERAGQKYVELRYRLIRYFGWNDCFPEEDLADTVFDRVTRKAESDEIRELGPFIWGVARNVVREFRRKTPDTDLNVLETDRSLHATSAELSVIESAERQRRLRCLHHCTRALSPEERELFLAYEYYTEKPMNTARLAEQWGMTVGALQTRAHRIKAKVELCARKCLASRTKMDILKSRIRL